MKSALAIIAVIMVLFMFGTMLSGIQGAQTDERDDAFAAVATGVGVTEADVELVADLYDEDILNVVDIASDNEDDAPLADSYAALTNTLTVRGLNANDTRTLEVTYQYDAMTGDASIVGSFFDLMPTLVVIALVLIIVGAMIMGYRSYRGG